MFTGDTLFRRSIGGIVSPGHTTFADLQRSIMEALLSLPGDTVVQPGHAEPSTIDEEWSENPFIRVWRGLDAEGDEPCRARGQQARLVLLASDYDGGHKAWVRWPDGRDEVMAGSMVERGS